jgi:hypothetical protein
VTQNNPNLVGVSKTKAKDQRPLAAAHTRRNKQKAKKK